MRTALLLIPALALAACAPGSTDRPLAEGADTSQTRTERRCFSVDQVRNFRGGRTGQLFIRAGGEVFELSTAGCLDLDLALRLAIVPSPAGLAGDRVCTGDPADIVVPGGGAAGLERCRARVTRVLSDAEVAALPDAQRP